MIITCMYSAVYVWILYSSLKAIKYIGVFIANWNVIYIYVHHRIICYFIVETWIIGNHVTTLIYFEAFRVINMIKGGTSFLSGCHMHTGIFKSLESVVFTHCNSVYEFWLTSKTHDVLKLK